MSDHYCEIHKCAKTWMISSSFCRLCDVASATETTKPVFQDYTYLICVSCGNWCAAGEACAFCPKPNTTLFMGVSPQANKSLLQSAWEAKYGKFQYVQFSGHGRDLCYPWTGVDQSKIVPGLGKKTLLISSGYPYPTQAGKNPTWHDSIAKVWPI